MPHFTTEPLTAAQREELDEHIANAVHYRHAHGVGSAQIKELGWLRRLETVSIYTVAIDGEEYDFALFE